MTNTELLEIKIKESGLRKGFIAEQMGLSAYGLSKKIAGENDFKVREVNQLCEILKITSLREKERIFFAN